MTSERVLLPPKPELPRDEDCCRSDCPNCVFTLYDRAVEAWEQEVAAIRARHAPPAQGPQP